MLFYGLLFVVPTVLQFAISDLSNYLNKKEFYVILIITIIAFFIIASIQVFLYAPLLISDEIIYGKCKNVKKKNCCVKGYIKSLKQSDKIRDFVLSKEMLNSYKLISTAEMNDEERKFVTQKNNGKVLVFSYDLSTEILEDESQNIVIENLQKGLKYVEFVIETEKTKNRIEHNKSLFYKKIPDRFAKNIEFKHIKENNDTINILPYLLGSIIFVVNGKARSYFSLRGDGSKKNDPMYFDMPACMNQAYYEYFSEKL